MLSRICQLADTVSDISRTSTRDKGNLHRLTNKHNRTIQKTENKLFVQQNFRKLCTDEPGSEWNTNVSALQSEIGKYSEDLKVADMDIQRLKQVYIYCLWITQMM